jgi:hypothetical protein
MCLVWTIFASGKVLHFLILNLCVSEHGSEVPTSQLCVRHKAFKVSILKAEMGIKLYMPSHLAHVYVDRMLFGRAYWKVHRLIDSAYPYLRGGHRIFWHDPISAIAIAADAYPWDANAVSAAIIHIQVDNMCSAYPNFRKQLEAYARADARKRRRSGRGGKLLARGFPELKNFMEDCRKWVELRKLMRSFRE